jgi:hypothetical protein
MIGTITEPEKQLAGILHRREPGLTHAEDADLLGRAEAVLAGAQQPKALAAIALEGEHRIHQVLEHARAGDGAIFGHVAHQDQRGPVCLRRRRQQCGTLAHLSHRARGRLDSLGAHGLDRIDQDERGACLSPGLGQPFDPCLRDDQQRIGNFTQPLGS